MSPTGVRESGRDGPRRLWLDFVNSEAEEGDALTDFRRLTAWLHEHRAIDEDRAALLARRAEQQPAGAMAALADALKVRLALRALADGTDRDAATIAGALNEINRILGRSAGIRRIAPRPGGRFAREFVPGGDAFAGLLIPVVESAADALIAGDLVRVRRCAAERCGKVFLDQTKNGRRRWCDMSTCGNRAKAARFRRTHRA